MDSSTTTTTKDAVTEEQLLARHMTRGGVVSNYKSSAVIADELDRETLRRAIKDAVLDYTVLSPMKLNRRLVN